MEVRVGYFVSFRGGGYGAYDSRHDAVMKAVQLISIDGNGFDARIYEGIVFLNRKRVCRGTQLSRLDIVTMGDCVAMKRVRLN